MDVLDERLSGYIVVDILTSPGVFYWFQLETWLIRISGFQMDCALNAPL